MNLPTPEYGANDKETIANLMDTVMKLRKELEYLMYHLGDANIPDLAGMKGDINGNHSLILQAEDEIQLLVTDVAGNTSAITVQAGQIASLVSDVAGNTSSITQLSGQITLKVDKNGVISAINLSPESITLSANKIDLNGITTVANTLTLGSLGNEGSLRFASGTTIYSQNLIDMVIGASGITIQASQLYLPSYCDLVVSGSTSVSDDFTFGGNKPIERGQYVKRIGAGSDRLYILFEDGSVHEVMFA